MLITLSPAAPLSKGRGRDYQWEFSYQNQVGSKAMYVQEHPTYIDSISAFISTC